MKLEYEKKIELMMSNFESLRNAFKWEHDLASHLIALNCAIRGKELDIQKIKDIKSYIKSETGMFSPFRGVSSYVISGLLSVGQKNPTEAVNSMLANEKILKSTGFKNSSYLPTALYTLENVYDGVDVNHFSKKAMTIYREMKDNHPFLTSGDDYALAILLASADRQLNALEKYYDMLNEFGFRKSNGLQMLSHILAFSDKDIRDNVVRCEKVYAFLKSQGVKVYSEYYPALGVISLLDDEKDEILDDLVEVLNFIKNQKGYKWLGKGMNLLIASAIITSEYIENKSNDTLVSTTLSISIEAIIAAQQAAMITAISAATVAAASN
ncbi:DUF4003 family protein [Vallitalea okinawensis]|uniref:DUF4003 family protein n=1 Tax=Vallitalea okinawensis TaxID=2078660 RepID=UPI000CFD105A|nr:DUF4003 family protein [Vallitalea okinawensis]